MIDFHSHVLPHMDDGAGSIRESLAMLRRSFLQGVDLVVATPHFYGDREYPQDFLRRRNQAFRQLQEAILMSPEVYPNVIPGAEVLYFPGICQAEAVASLKVGRSRCLLVEPPMAAWTDDMLDDIARLRQNFGCVPVIAHVDRYMHCLEEPGLMERVRARGMMVQVNAEYFLNPRTVKTAMAHLKKGHIQLIGSDCHNLDSRPPNLGLAWQQAKALGLREEFRQLHQNAMDLLQGRECL